MNIRTLFGRNNKDEAAVAADPAREAAVKDAYERGRRDERARQSRRRRGFPMLTLILLLVAGAGATAVYLGVHEGSFTRGGQVVDQNIGAVGQGITNTTAPATQAARSAADAAAEKLEQAGKQLKRAAGS